MLQSTRHVDTAMVVKMSLPIFVELLLQMLVGNVDQFMLSHFSQNSVGAVGNANQILNLIIITFSVISTAATILISQYLGAQQYEKANEVCTLAILINALAGVGISGLLLLLHRPIFQAMQVPESILAEAGQYLCIVGGSVFIQAVYLTFVAIFRSYGRMRYTMQVSILMNLLNIVGNVLLIHGIGPIPALGITGAAISTVISKCVGLLLICYLFRSNVEARLSTKYLKPFPWNTCKTILYIGLPSGGEEAMYNLSQIVILAMVNVFGSAVLNTKIYCSMIIMIAYIYAQALAQAAQVAVGYLIGQGQEKQLNHRVRVTVLTAILVGEGITLLIFLCSNLLLRIFTDDPQVLALGKIIFAIELALELGRAINIVMVRLLQAVGDIKTPVTVGILSMWLVSVLFSWLFGIHLGWGLPGMWIAMAMDECLRGGIFLWRWKSGGWKGKTLIEVPRPAESLPY